MSIGLTGLFVLGLTSALPVRAASVPIQRISGTDAIGTSIAVSQAEFPGPGSASGVVVARSDFFADALAGGPLAAKVGGPLLITPGAALSTALDPRVQAEIQRVLPSGKTVYILGGSLALSPNIDASLQQLGYVVVRIAGTDEYATAVDIAVQLGNPSTIFEATGLSFADALSAVPAAVQAQGAILLTQGNTQAPATAQYLATHPSDLRYAIGGPLAAAGADPTATAVYGQDLYATSAAVASRFFPTTDTFGAATGTNFPDALSGGAFMGTRLPIAGPMLLVESSGSLPPSIAAFLSNPASTFTQGYLFGGPLAVGDDVLTELGSPGSSMSSSALSITTTQLPGATVGTAYSVTLAASGGTPPYTWGLSSGALPPGLTLSSEGVISGTPTAQGTSNFTVQASDTTSPTPEAASQALSIAVSFPPVVMATSPNWSGYVLGSGPFTYATGTFSVPNIATGTPLGNELSEWVGIDGYGNSSLIQAGINESIDPHNTNSVLVQPWWVILPAHPTEIPITTLVIRPGDQLTVTIGVVSGSEWGITLEDETTGASFTTDQTYAGPESTVDWIVEAPLVNGAITGLAQFAPAVRFSNLRFAGAPETTLTDLVMVQGGLAVATPSALDSNGFNVAFGGVAPAAP